jgi:sugar phosphate isomerase/epimerase
VPRKLKGDEFEKFAIEICKRIIDATADSGVRLGIENHGRTSNNTEFLERLFAGVGSDRLGLTLDTANFYWYGYRLSDLYGIYKKFARRAFHTHCKNIAYPGDFRDARRPMGWKYGEYNCPIDKGDIDFTRVVAILREANYRGDLCIENESLGKFPKEKRGAILAREAAFLRKIAAKI